MTIKTANKNTANPDIVFVQQYPMTYFGIIALDGHLKRAGYIADVVISALEKDIIGPISRLKPKMIGLSVFSTEHSWLVNTVKVLKKAFPETPIIVGGIHAIVYPETILKESDADIVCYTDGEEVLVNILSELKKEIPDWLAVKGIAYKAADGKIVKNAPCELSAFRDDIVDLRDIYLNRYPGLAEDKICYFISSRGCPYSCSFCYNSYLRKVLGSVGYLRRKSVNNFIEEITAAVKAYKPKSAFFIDDLFTFDKLWLKEFLTRYKKEIGLPFVCMTRANMLDEETAKMLSAAGCQAASFGIETGNENLRKTVLNKDITNEQIKKCGNLLNKYGITVRASSMFCLPDETLKDSLETVELNIKSKVNLAASMLLILYPKTEITEYAIKKKLLPAGYSLKDLPEVSYKNSSIDMPDKEKIINVHFLLYFFARYPRIYDKFGKIIHNIYMSPVFYLIFYLGYFIRNKNENGLSFTEALGYAWRKRSLLMHSSKNNASRP